MPFTQKTFIRSTRRIVICALFILPAVAITALSSIHDGADPPVIAQAPPTESIPAMQSQRAVELKRITIRPTGFDPSEITCHQRHIVLAIHNRSGLDQVVLRIRRETGELHREVRLPKDQPNWRGAIELSPGRYTVTEVNHSDWVCSIVVAG